MPDRQIPPRNIVITSNDGWRDDQIIGVNFDGDLQPGDEEVVAVVESTQDDVDIFVSGVGTTAHGADIDGDGTAESIVRYRFEHRKKPNDRWNALPGLNTTLSIGSLGRPESLYEGGEVGPMSGFRIVFENRSDQFSNPQSVDEDEIGGEIHARVNRGGGN